MATEAIELRAHLMRRVGVGATRDELDDLAERPYEELVEELLHPQDHENPSADLLDRYFPAVNSPDVPLTAAAIWIFNLANSGAPLGEKMALFWHHVFATGWFKGEHGPAMLAQIEMFRRNGLGNLREILLDLSHDPAMLYWLDNCENHATEINENYGRELLELFSMGIGSYSEDDIRPPRVPSPAGPSSSRSRSTPPAVTARSSSSARTTTTTARRPSSVAPGTSTATTSSM